MKDGSVTKTETAPSGVWRSVPYLALPALALLSGCSSTPVVVEDKGAELSPYSNDEIVAEAKKLLGLRTEISDKSSADTLRALEEFLATDTFATESSDRGVTGVVVYSYGVGGFIYEGGNAGIHASFHGGDTSVPASGRFHGLGATLGGKGGWGIGLLYGLEYQGWFIGEYQGKRGGATAVESSVGGGVLLHQQFGHRLRTISTGSGLYAGAGVITLNVRWSEGSDDGDAGGA
jgi:hypothetical protein